MLSVIVVSVTLVYCTSAVLPVACSGCATIVDGSNSTPDLALPDCCGDINNGTVYLDGALAELRSNSTLLLCPGQHTIRTFNLIRDLTHVSIRSTAGSGATITCHEDVGLAFVNVSHLQIENVDIVGCGMRHNATVTVETVLNTTLDMFFRIPNETRVAVVVGNCAHVDFTNVTVANSLGLGLVGINVVGNSVLQGTQFLNNTYVVCENDSLKFDPSVVFKQGGGGAFFLYHNYRQQEDNLHRDTNLTIADSNFTGNAECSPAIYTQLNFPSLETFLKVGYIVGGGGGLTVMLAHSLYQVNVSVKHSELSLNQAHYGSGANIGIFRTAANFLVQFQDCSFIKNGLEPPDTYKFEQFSVGGSGMAIINAMVNPRFVRPAFERKNGYVFIENSKFLQNYAYKGSGLFVFSYYSGHYQDLNHRGTTFVNLVNCSFKLNVGAVGPAVYAAENKDVLVSVGMLLRLTDVDVVNNTVAPLDGSPFQPLLESSGAVHVRNMYLILTGQCSIKQNQGTGVYARESAIVVSSHSHVNVASNTGAFGGGMTLLFWTHIYLQSNSTLTFINNTGKVSGGALYVQVLDSVETSYSDCFLYFFDQLFLTFDTLLFNEGLPSVRVEFAGNQAPTGSIMFGSSLETCAWVSELKQRTAFTGNDQTALDFLHRVLPTVFYFDVAPHGVDKVSTPTVHLNLPNVPHSAMPGQTLNLSVNAVDRLSQYAPTVITSDVLTGHNASTLVGSSGYRSLSARADSEVPLRLTGQVGDEVDVVLYSIESYADAHFIVTLLDCSPGFVYSEDARICTCDSELMSRNVDCDTETAALTVPNHMWIGPVHGSSQIDLVEVCVLDYCEPGAKTIFPQLDNSYDSQCNSGYHRTGILCGQCDHEHGYSVAFGTNKCIKCSHVYLLLIIVFIVAGILLVLSISLLHITIARGYLNAVLLYSNVTSIYSSFLTLGSPAIFVLTSFLNLNVGIELCFFDGMDSVARVGLQLVFPAYLFLLIGLITCLARVKPFQWLTRPPLRPVKMFATLLILCYSSVLGTCIEILGVIRMRTLSGEILVRWSVDPNVEYFHGWHGFLGSIAVLLVVFYISIFPLLLMIPTKWLKRLPYIGRNISRVDPLFDALYGPFKVKARPWLGVRLVLRVFPLVFVFFTEFPLNVFLLAIFLLALLQVYFIIRPFKSMMVNVIDNLLIANGALLSLGTLYFDANEHSEAVAIGYSYSLVIVAYTFIAMIFGYDVIVRFAKNQRAKDCYYKLFKRLPLTINASNIELSDSVSPEPETPVPTIPPTPQEPVTLRPKKPATTTVVDFTAPRESLLEPQ